MHSVPGEYRGFLWFFFINEQILRFLNLHNILPCALFLELITYCCVEQVASQSYVPPDVKNDKALITAVALLHKGQVKQGRDLRKT